MPNLKSAIKRVQVAERNKFRNLVWKTKIKTLLKKVYDFASKKDQKSAISSANEAFAVIDKASTKRIIHPNNAKRKKARISGWLKTIEGSKKF